MRRYTVKTSSWIYWFVEICIECRKDLSQVLSAMTLDSKHLVAHTKYVRCGV